MGKRADLVARGMDFVGVRTVVNYDFPQSPVEYVHRVGRTGRAGRSGEAVTLYTDSDAGALGAGGGPGDGGGLCWRRGRLGLRPSCCTLYACRCTWHTWGSSHYAVPERLLGHILRLG